MARKPAEPTTDRTRDLVAARRRRIWLTADEVAALLATGPRDDLQAHRDRVLLALGTLSGLRVLELCWVQWGGVDLRARTIAVRPPGGRHVARPITRTLVEELFAWRGVYAREADRPVDTKDYVIVNLRSSFVYDEEQRRHVLGPTWDRGIGPWSALKIVQHHGIRIGVPALRPADLRRSHAGILDALGAPRPLIQELLRLPDGETTEAYLAANPARVAGARAEGLGGPRVEPRDDPYPFQGLEIE